MGGLASIAGPPLILWFSLAKVNPKLLPTLMVPVFLICDGTSLVMASIRGNMNWHLWPTYFGSAGGCLLGMGVGVMLRPKVKAEMIQLLLYILVAVTGLNESGAFRLNSTIGDVCLGVFLTSGLLLLLYWIYRQYLTKCGDHAESEGEEEEKNVDNPGKPSVMTGRRAGDT